MCKVFGASPKHLILCFSVGVLEDKDLSSRILEDNCEVLNLGLGFEGRVLGLGFGLEAYVLDSITAGR